MALQKGQFGVLFESQPVDGVLAPGLKVIYDGLNPLPTANGPFDDTDGAVFGDPESGVGASGIDVTLGRNARGPAFVSGSDTRKFDEFLNGTVNTFAFSWPISGPKTTTTTPLASEFQLDAGREALYQSAGLTGSAGAASFIYTPVLPATPAARNISALVFDSGTVYAIINAQCSLDFAFNVGGAGIHTANFTAKLDPINVAKEATFPTITYGQQDQVAAPNIAEVQNAFGQVRGFSDLTVTIDNQIAGTPDSNAVDGERIESSGRLVNIACTLDVDDGGLQGPAFDVNHLLAAVAETDDMVFQAGTLNAGAEPAVSYLVTMADLNLQDLTPAQPANAKSSQFTAFATSTIDGGEFAIEFN